MKKRIGTIKGKPIVEGGGSNIIKNNEISINDIGNSSDSGNNNDDNISYFGFSFTNPETHKLLKQFFPLSKIVSYNSNSVRVEIPATTYPDSHYFHEFGGNINDKQAYYNGNWLSLKEFINSTYNFDIEKLKPISKEEFYRTEYTVEEAEKIRQEYYDYMSQFAPSKTE